MRVLRIFLHITIAVLGGFLSPWIESPLFAQATSPQEEEAAIPLPPIASSDTVVTFDYPDADLADIVAAISKLTGKNFILDPNVKGKVSIISPSPVTVEEAYRAFLSALAINKFSIVPSGKYLKIVRQRDATTDSIQTFTGDYTPVIDNFVTQIIHLKYINAEEVRRTFRDLTTREAQLIAYAPTNSVILADTGSNVARLLEILKTLDVAGFEDKLEVVPIQHAAASEIASLLEGIFEISGTRGAPAGAFPRPRVPSPITPGATTRGGGASISKIIADDRTNSLIVLANEAGLERLKEMLAKLDIEIKGAGKIHVYYMQNSNAEDVSETLSALVQGAQPGIRRPAPAAGAFAQRTEVGAFEGGIRIQANKSTNSLVITASPQDFETIKKVIEQLDIPRKQVFVETYIMEVSLTKKKEFGISYLGGLPIGENGLGGSLAGGGNIKDVVNFLKDPLSLNTSGGVLGYLSRATATLQTSDGKTVTIRSALALVKALQTTGQVDLLSAPRILTIDNEEAEFKVGEKVPTFGASTISTAGNQQTIVDKDVFLQLKVKPQINETSEFVRLKLEQAVNALSAENVPSELTGKSVATTERALKTTVVIRDRDTVVLGGLIKDDVKRNESKVPILGDIPLLGWLFKTQTSEMTKSNLLIFITPHIIHTRQDFRKVFDDNLREREQFLEKFQVGKDTKEDFINKFNPPKLTP